jgi:hypothetical protein
MENHPTSLKFFLILIYSLKINNLQAKQNDASRHRALILSKETTLPVVKYFNTKYP